MSARDGVVTPEAVLLRFDTAGVPSRALAKLLDVAVAGVALLVAFVAALGLAGGDVDGSEAAVIALVVSTVGLFAYPALAEARFGTTLGKAACGLRVVTVEGGPVRLRHGLIRAALQVVDLVAVPVGVIGVASMLASPLDQRVGDRVAGTLVLRSRSAAVASHAVAFPALPGYEGYVASLDVTAVTPEQYEVLRAFLIRVDQLRPEARFQLAERLARPLSAAMRHDVPTWLHPELFCACVAAAYQQRHGGPAWA